MTQDKADSPVTQAEPWQVLRSLVCGQHPFWHDEQGWRDLSARLANQAQPTSDVREAAERAAHALEKAAGVFHHHAELQKAKGTRDGDQKAAVNVGYSMEFAEAADDVLAALSQPLPEPQTVADGLVVAAKAIMRANRDCEPNDGIPADAVPSPYEYAMARAAVQALSRNEVAPSGADGKRT